MRSDFNTHGKVPRSISKVLATTPHEIIITISTNGCYTRTVNRRIYPSAHFLTFGPNTVNYNWLELGWAESVSALEVVQAGVLHSPSSRRPHRPAQDASQVFSRWTDN